MSSAPVGSGGAASRAGGGDTSTASPASHAAGGTSALPQAPPRRGTCSGAGTVCEICGCDGVTYPDIQTACRAGVSAAVSGACGVGVDAHGDAAAGPLRIGCGSNGQCPAAQVCCLITGSCVDPACATCCSFPPPGTRIACADERDCFVGVESCVGSGCGTAGGCALTPSMSSCGGELAPVCGCDGRSYTNACWALAAPTRVAHTGMCP